MTADKWKLRMDLIGTGFVKQERTPFADYVEFKLVWGDMTMWKDIYPNENIKDELDGLWEDFFFHITTRYFSIKSIATKSYDSATQTLAQ